MPELPTPPSMEEIMKIVMPLVGPNGPFTLGVNERGRYFTKAPRNMLQFYVSQFTEYANKTFLVFEKERYSFEETWNIAKDLGVLLSNKFQLTQGDRVGIAMRNYPEWCISFITCGTTGSIAVPINSFWKGNELEYGIKDSGSKILFCDFQRYNEILPFIEKLQIKVIVVRAPGKEPLKLAIRYEDLIREIEIKNRPSNDELIRSLDEKILPDDVAMITYTSGTTGNPKGVVLTHRGILNQMEVGKFLTFVQEKISELPNMPPIPQVDQHCILCAVPLFHVTGSHHNFLQSLVIGRKLVLIYKWDAELALQLIEQEKVTNWTGVPTMALDIMEHPSFSKYNTSSLLTIGSGGAHTPAHQVKRTAETFKNGVPTSAYGLTETNGAICLNSALNYLRKPTSCGSPFINCEIKVVDIDTGKVLPPNERGELLIKSNLIMKEYWNKPIETAKVMTSDHFFRTGDIATLDEEGFIYIVDRAKDIIIRGGENISCSEVENAIYKNSAVRECAVFGVPDDRLGEIVGVLIMLKKPLTAEELVSFLHGKIAPFKIPAVSNVYFTKNPLPRGATGKIVKRAIKDKILGANATSKL